MAEIKIKENTDNAVNNKKNKSKISNKWVWIDLEMSGLNPDKDKILEIATIITDQNLNIIKEGPSLVIHQSNDILDSMDEWNTEHHKASGLTEKVRKSAISNKQAEDITLNFIKEYCQPCKAPLCGNSVHQDKAFLRRYMPCLHDYLSYRIIDVSTIKAVVNSWYPNNKNRKFKKKDEHRALSDIKESIKELDHYKKNFFIKN